VKLVPCPAREIKGNVRLVTLVLAHFHEIYLGG